MVLLLVASFTFAQEKNVKRRLKVITNGVNPDFAKAEELINQALTNPGNKGQCRNVGM